MRIYQKILLLSLLSSSLCADAQERQSVSVNAVETWVRGKLYKLGAVVLYSANGKYYKLVRVDATRTSNGTNPTISTWYWQLTTAPVSAPIPVLTGTAVLTWTPPTGEVTGYRVYYGTAPRTYLQTLGNGIRVSSPTATITGLQPGKTYYFTSTALDANGNESAYSNEGSKVIPLLVTSQKIRR